MTNDATGRAHCPDDVLRMLPWYDDEALGDDERARIEAHAAACADCRREIDWMLGGDDEAARPAPDADAAYARVRARIEASGAREAARAAAHERIAAHRQRADRGVAWRRLAIAASLAAVAAGVGAGFAAGRRSAIADAPVYETAQARPVSAGAPGAATQARELDVVFARAATAERIGDALRAIGADVVAGPTRLGVYRVRLQPGADAATAAERLRGGARPDGVETGVASLAEPVAP